MCYVNSQCLFLTGEELRSWGIGQSKTKMLDNMYAHPNMIPTILFAKQDRKWHVQPTPMMTSKEDVEKRAKKNVKNMSIAKTVCTSNSIFLTHNTSLY
jgi:hypothetical protein